MLLKVTLLWCLAQYVMMALLWWHGQSRRLHDELIASAAEAREKAALVADVSSAAGHGLVAAARNAGVLWSGRGNASHRVA